MTFPSIARRVILTCVVLAPLAGCGGPQRPLTEDQQARAACRVEADRIYNVQNRAQLSEQDNRDTPFSANAAPAPNSLALSDQYAHDQMVTNCLNHTETGTETGPDITPGSQAAPH